MAPKTRIPDGFHPAVAQWFAQTFPAPTPAQHAAWVPILEGRSTLLLAPTGSGKTLAAFLVAIHKLMFGDPNAKGCRVLYLSPLKALAHDVERNLRSPIAGITRVAQQLGLPHRVPDVAIRTGDTPANARARMRRHPPDILITTPESLYLMLTSGASELLTTVETVIVDEIHAMVPSKRGSHLFLSLERLEELGPPGRPPRQRIGLSATQKPLEEVARLLGGGVVRADGGWEPRPVAVVDAGAKKQLDVRVEVPVEDMSTLSEGAGPGTDNPLEGKSIWPAMHPRLVELIRAHRSTMIFVNSRRLAERLAGAGSALSRKRALLGFDGFIDTLAYIPRDGSGPSTGARAITGTAVHGARVRGSPDRGRADSADGPGPAGHFASIADFGACLAGRRARSCSFELRRITVKQGGNMPILALALGTLGCRVDCIGTLGYPRVDPLFEPLGSRGTILSYADPGATLALEFGDGKVMLYTPPGSDVSWETLRERVGDGRLSEAIRNCHLVGLLNWAELANSQALWEGLLGMADAEGARPGALLVADLSDCSGRSAGELSEVLGLLARYRDRYRVLLSMNEGEAHAVHAVLTGEKPGGDTRSDRVDACGRLCGAIGRRLGVFALVIHARDRACAWTDRGLSIVGTRVVTGAVFGTGGGDNFNAGLCAGLLLDSGMEECLAMGNAAASFYVETGRSPALPELARSLGNYPDRFRPLPQDAPDGGCLP